MTVTRKSMAASLPPSTGVAMTVRRLEAMAGVLLRNAEDPEIVRRQAMRLQEEARHMQTHADRRPKGLFAHGELRDLVLAELSDQAMGRADVLEWARLMEADPCSVLATMDAMARRGSITRTKIDGRTVFSLPT